MKRLKYFIPIALMGFSSCNTDASHNNDAWNKHDTVLRLPQIEAGMTFDPTLSKIEIKSIVVEANPYDVRAYVQPWSKELSDTVNVFVDSLVPEQFVDSIIDLACPGKDLRLIGMNNGKEIAIPFHALHRFSMYADTLPVSESEYQIVFVEAHDITINDVKDKVNDEKKYFRAFYGDAFNPADQPWKIVSRVFGEDSLMWFPQRKSHRVTIDELETEGQSWDEMDIKKYKDTAFMLATYNEFVNKLEVYDKLGSFCTMHMAVMDVTPLDVNWNRMMHFFSAHFAVQKSLREIAKQYAADYAANNGKPEPKELTDEDLRLLYPDRLRWNGRMSGAAEHRFDMYDLAEYYWADPPKQEKPGPARVPLNN